MEWSIQEVARFASTTSRTLRHYDESGLVPPSRVGANGYRYYDDAALRRLQRVLLLRELGLGLPAIADVLSRNVDEVAALHEHATTLRETSKRLARQIVAVEHAINTLTEKDKLMPDQMFDGFDHSQYRDEVVARWGEARAHASDRWWGSKSADGKRAWKEEVGTLSRDWIAAATAPGADPTSEQASALAARHVAWLRGIPGTPAAEPDGDIVGYVRGLADMYVADERFAANYGGEHGASYVRDALHHFVDTNLTHQPN